MASEKEGVKGAKAVEVRHFHDFEACVPDSQFSAFMFTDIKACIYKAKAAIPLAAG